jgi:hypothetical protein
MKNRPVNPLTLGSKLSRAEMKKITAGTCNAGQYYDKPCYGISECGGADCAGTLYCYHANGNPYTLGVCLFT